MARIDSVHNTSSLISIKLAKSASELIAHCLETNKQKKRSQENVALETNHCRPTTCSTSKKKEHECPTDYIFIHGHELAQGL